MGGAVCGEELDTKVANSESEGSGQGYVCPKNGGVCHRSVAMGLEVAGKALVGDYSGFLDSVHSLSDIAVDIVTRVGDGEEGVLNNHLVWDVF